MDNKIKGILVCGGLGTRLSPLTKGISKHLLNVYDKPMFYYSLSQLLLANIRDITIVSQKQYLQTYRQHFGNGQSIGVRIRYVAQDDALGIPDAIKKTEKLYRGHPIFVVLGDNFLQGPGLSTKLLFDPAKDVAQIFAYLVRDPRPYGVIEYSENGKCVGIEEKPTIPKSNWVSIGSYFFPTDVYEKIDQISQYPNGEYHVVDLLKLYLNEIRLDTKRLGRGYVWYDLGTHEKLYEAASFIKAIQKGQGYSIGSPLDIAKVKNFIS